MAVVKLYEFAVIKQPLEDDDGKIKESGELIVPLTPILATDESQATILASRAIPDEHIGDLDRITIAIRPF